MLWSSGWAGKHAALGVAQRVASGGMRASAPPNTKCQQDQCNGIGKVHRRSSTRTIGSTSDARCRRQRVAVQWRPASPMARRRGGLEDRLKNYQALITCPMRGGGVKVVQNQCLASDMSCNHPMHFLRAARRSRGGNWCFQDADLLPERRDYTTTPRPAKPITVVVRGLRRPRQLRRTRRPGAAQAHSAAASSSRCARWPWRMRGASRTSCLRPMGVAVVYDACPSSTTAIQRRQK